MAKTIWSFGEPENSMDTSPFGLEFEMPVAL
jgi:hypothetical protein